MPDKFELKQMLEEIREDEGMGTAPKGKISQETIQKMMREKLKKRKEAK